MIDALISFISLLCLWCWFCDVPMWRIAFKVLFCILLVFLAVMNDLHIGWTLFVICVIISLSEKEIVYRAIYGDTYMQNERNENDLIKLEEMLNNINRYIGKLNVNLKESKYKEIKCNIDKELSAIKELLDNNYELNDIEYNENRPCIYDRYSMIYNIVKGRIAELPLTIFELKRELDERKLKEKIKTRSGNIDSMLIKIFDDKEDGDRYGG